MTIDQLIGEANALLARERPTEAVGKLRQALEQAEAESNAEKAREIREAIDSLGPRVAKWEESKRSDKALAKKVYIGGGAVLVASLVYLAVFLFNSGPVPILDKPTQAAPNYVAWAAATKEYFNKTGSAQIASIDVANAPQGITVYMATIPPGSADGYARLVWLRWSGEFPNTQCSVTVYRGSERLGRYSPR